MKSLSKGILGLTVISLVGVVSFNLFNKRDLKPTIEKNKLAVFIKSEDGSYKVSNTIPSVGYTLNIDKSVCSNGAKPTWKDNGLNIANLTEENTNCYLYFDEDVATKKLKELGLSSNTGTPDFSQVATTDEGIYAVEDGMYGGTSYYWRGAATTNYVKFGGYCWRGVRINGDGSLRLIYDGSTCHANGTNTTDSIAVQNVAYNTNYDRSEYVGWTYEIGKQRPDNNLTATASNAKTQTDNWYNTNIGNNATYASKVADGKYCNDREVASGYTWSSQPSSTFYYVGYDRSGANSLSAVTPILSCINTGDVYTLKVGAITMDEIAIAGGKYGTKNNLYHLYNGQSYLSMSPCRSYANGSFPTVFYVSVNGQSNHINAHFDSVGLRPVINLLSNTTFTGNGTIDNPFVVEGAE